MADARGIQDPQGAAALGTSLLGIERMVGRATQGAIGLRGKCGTRETMRKRGAREFRRAIGDRGGGRFRRCRLIS